MYFILMFESINTKEEKTIMYGMWTSARGPAAVSQCKPVGLAGSPEGFSYNWHFLL